MSRALGFLAALCATALAGCAADPTPAAPGGEQDNQPPAGQVPGSVPTPDVTPLDPTPTAPPNEPDLQPVGKPTRCEAAPGDDLLVHSTWVDGTPAIGYTLMLYEWAGGAWGWMGGLRMDDKGCSGLVLEKAGIYQLGSITRIEGCYAYGANPLNFRWDGGEPVEVALAFVGQDRCGTGTPPIGGPGSGRPGPGGTGTVGPCEPEPGADVLFRTSFDNPDRVWTPDPTGLSSHLWMESLDGRWLARARGDTAACFTFALPGPGTYHVESAIGAGGCNYWMGKSDFTWDGGAMLTIEQPLRLGETCPIFP